MFLSPEIETTYQERLKRYVTAMKGGVPDRIPIRFLYEEIISAYAGTTNQVIACDYQQAFDCTRKMGEEYQSDAVMLNAVWNTYSVAKAASWRYFAVPGVDVSIESTPQFYEPGEHDPALVEEDELLEFAADPTRFLYEKWLPRATTRGRVAGQPTTYENHVSLVSGAIAYTQYMNAFGPAAYKLKYHSGIVSANSGMIKAPLDLVQDKLRGYFNTCIDLYERPDELLKLCESLMPHIVANALAGADPDKNVPITIWAHRGRIPFITQEAFDQIYWATLKPVFEEIIAHGHQILFYSEGDWTPHYDALLELPERSLIFHLTEGDPKIAARKLKPKFAISGGVRYDVLAQGTPQEVRNHLKELFAALATEGGYILDATSLMMHDIKLENVRAAVDYTLEYGGYSRSTPAHALGRPEASARIPVPQRPPHVCIPWEEEQKSYSQLTGDVDLVRKTWQGLDAAAYEYLWTTLLW